MSNSSTDSERKRLCAHKAVDLFIESNTLVGLGTGTTANHIVARIAEKLKEGSLTNVVGVPTSEATAATARECGVPLMDLSELGDRRLAVTLDGADEVAAGAAGYNVVKGLGGALFREKLVANESDHYVIMVLEDKLKEGLGACKIPAEVLPFGWERTARRIKSHPELSKYVEAVELRRNADGSPFLTDNNNYNLLITIGGNGLIPSKALDDFAASLKSVCGVLEHGLFLNFNPSIVVGDAQVKDRRSQ